MSDPDWQDAGFRTESNGDQGPREAKLVRMYASDETSASSDSSDGISTLVGVVLLIGLVSWYFRDTTLSIVDLWSYEGFRHCALIPLISLYLFWSGRERIAHERWDCSFLGLAALALALWMWIVGNNLSLQVLEQLAFIGVVNAIVWAVAGTAVFRALLFPLLYLVLAVPVGDGTIPWLIELTADVALASLQAVGVPVFREGAFMSLPGGSFEVARSCSGFHYINAGLALSLLAGYLAFKRWWKIAISTTLFVLACVVMNGVRVFLTMWIASASDMRYLAGEDHVIFGWVLFALLLMALLMISRRYADWET